MSELNASCPAAPAPPGPGTSPVTANIREDWREAVLRTGQPQSRTLGHAHSVAGLRDCWIPTLPTGPRERARIHARRGHNFGNFRDRKQAAARARTRGPPSRSDRWEARAASAGLISSSKSSTCSCWCWTWNWKRSSSRRRTSRLPWPFWLSFSGPLNCRLLATVPKRPPRRAFADKCSPLVLMEQIRYEDPSPAELGRHGCSTDCA